MTLDERIKSFRRHVPRPTEWDSEHGTTVKLIYDLIDERSELKAQVEWGGISEEAERASKDRVLRRYDKVPG